MDGGMITASVVTEGITSPNGNGLSIVTDGGNCVYSHGQRQCLVEPEIPFYIIPSGTTGLTLSATKTFQSRSWSHPFVITRISCKKTNINSLADGGAFRLSIPSSQQCNCSNGDSGRTTMLCTPSTGVIQASCQLTDSGPCIFPGGKRVDLSYFACASASPPVVDDCLAFGYFSNSKGIGSDLGLPYTACVGEINCIGQSGSPISSSPDAGEELSFQFQNQTDYIIRYGTYVTNIDDTNVGPWVRTDDTLWITESPRPGTAKGYGSSIGVFLAARAGAIYGLVRKSVGDGPWTWWTNGLQGAAGLSNTGCYLGTEMQLGESNESAGSTAADWATYMDEWQSDAQIYLRSHVPCTGTYWSSYQQAPLIMMQLSSSTLLGMTEADHVPAGQVLAAKLFPDRIALAGPQYWTTYESADLRHDAIGMCMIQSLYGNVLREWWERNGHWEPTWMTDAVWDSSTGIDVTWHVPYPPLSLGCPEGGTDPGNWGMTFTDDSGSPPSVTSVSLTGCPQWETCTMHIELDGIPSGTGMFIESAYRGSLGASAGPSSGMRSCIHDSATWMTDCGSPLDGSDPQSHHVHNWAVHQAQAVN